LDTYISMRSKWYEKHSSYVSIHEIKTNSIVTQSDCMGGVYGGAGGALGGHLQHLQFKSAVFNSSRYLAECKECAAMFPGVSGTWLDPVYINGQRTLATGAVQPSYFFEELVIGNGIGKLASGIVGMIKGVGFAKGAVQATESTITGFAKHSVNRAIERGFKTGDILKIVKEGTPVQAMGRYGAQTRYALGGNTVVLNAQGKLITVFSNANGTANGLGRGFLIPFK